MQLADYYVAGVDQVVCLNLSAAGHVLEKAANATTVGFDILFEPDDD